MITIECTLKTREDLRQLTPLEIKIADCLSECYYEDDDFYTLLTKEESLPILLYFNIIRHIVSSLRNDPLPKLLLIEYYKQLSYTFSLSYTNFKKTFKHTFEMYADQPSFLFDYKANYEFDRALIWGGLYQLIQADHVLTDIQKKSFTQCMINCIQGSSFRESCFDPFLRIELEETPQPVSADPKEPNKPLANEPATDEPQGSETVPEESLTNDLITEKSSEEITLPDYIKLDDLLEKALLHYPNDDAFIQWMKALLTMTVNEQSGGDPNINNLLKAKLKLFSQKVKQKQEVEKKKHSTPKFLHLILHPEPNKLLRRLHRLINGKSGAEVGAVLLRAQQKGYLSKVPTQAEFESEFTLNGGWNAIHNYMNDNNQKALAKANKIIIFEGE